MKFSYLLLSAVSALFLVGPFFASAKGTPPSVVKGPPGKANTGKGVPGGLREKKSISRDIEPQKGGRGGGRGRGGRMDVSRGRGGRGGRSP